MYFSLIKTHLYMMYNIFNMYIIYIMYSMYGIYVCMFVRMYISTCVHMHL